MTYLFITLPFLFFMWMVYSSRNALLVLGRWILNRRYEVKLELDMTIEPDKTYLVLPNHPAIVDPLVLVTELHRYRLDICPLVDESFFSTAFVRHILALFNAVRVPDFRKSNFRPVLKVRPKYRSSSRRARALGYTVLALLASGQNVLLYPSGHITEDGRESLGNRQLAYNVISKMSELPEGIEIIGVRMRGLFGSMWSRAGRSQPPRFIRTLVKAILIWPFSPFRRKRAVRIKVENITERVSSWSHLSRMEFDDRLERWYNADLEAAGLRVENPS